MNTFTYQDLLQLALPEVIVIVTALLVLALDLMFLRGSEKPVRTYAGAIVSLLGCAAAVAWILHSPQSANVLDGMIVLNPLAQRMQIALLILSVADDPHLHRLHVHRTYQRVSRSHPARHRQHDVPRQHTEPPAPLLIAGAAQPLALHPGRLQQTQRPLRRGSIKVFRLRRNLRRISPLRLQPALRPVQLDKPRSHRQHHPRIISRPTLVSRHRNDDQSASDSK